MHIVIGAHAKQINKNSKFQTMKPSNDTDTIHKSIQGLLSLPLHHSNDFESRKDKEKKMEKRKRVDVAVIIEVNYMPR